MLIGSPGTLTGARVLEIGCGRGVGIEILLALGATHVVWFDLDPKMIALAQKRTARYGNRVQVFVGDAEKVDLPDASFDVVVDFGILHHVPGWKKALGEITRLLKPGGCFYFEDIFKKFTHSLLVRALTDHPLDTQFTGEEFRMAMEQAGMTVIKWRQMGDWVVIGRSVKANGQF